MLYPRIPKTLASHMITLFKKAKCKALLSQCLKLIIFNFKSIYLSSCKCSGCLLLLMSMFYMRNMFFVRVAIMKTVGLFRVDMKKMNINRTRISIRNFDMYHLFKISMFFFTLKLFVFAFFHPINIINKVIILHIVNV